MARDCARRMEYWKRMKVPRQLRAENLALFYKLQELQTVASPQIPVVRQPEKFGCLERTSAVPQSNKMQEPQTVASPQIPVVRQPEKSGSLERTSAASQSYQLQDTETVASPQVHVVRQPEKSGSFERTSSVSQSFNHWKGTCWHSPISFGFKLTICRGSSGAFQWFFRRLWSSGHCVCALPEKRKTDRITGSVYSLDQFTWTNGPWTGPSNYLFDQMGCIPWTKYQLDQFYYQSSWWRSLY